MQRNLYQCSQVIRISVLYHRRRQAWFERWDIAAKTLALVSSALVIYADKWDIHPMAAGSAILTAIVTMAVVVGGATRKAVTHNTLAARWLDLQADLERLGAEPKEDDLMKVRERIAQLRREELPEFGALIRLCQREVMRGDGFEEGRLPQVPRLHRWLCHWIDFQTPPSESKENAAGTL
jgi:hypothetical protein